RVILINRQAYVRLKFTHLCVFRGLEVSGCFFYSLNKRVLLLVFLFSSCYILFMVFMILRCLYQHVSPLSIPNREVKCFSVDGTTLWRSRSLPLLINIL